MEAPSKAIELMSVNVLVLLQNSPGSPGKPHFQIEFEVIIARFNTLFPANALNVELVTSQQRIPTTLLCACRYSKCWFYHVLRQGARLEGSLLLDHRIVQMTGIHLSRRFLNVPVTTFCTKTPEGAFPPNQPRRCNLWCGFPFWLKAPIRNPGVLLKHVLNILTNLRKVWGAKYCL